MQQHLHHGESVETSGDVVHYDADAFWQFFQLTNRRRLDDIEPSKKYKAREQRFPRHGNGDESNELAGNFIDHDKLGIF